MQQLSNVTISLSWTMTSILFTAVSIRQAVGISNEGDLQIDENRVLWKTASDKEIQIPIEDINRFTWTPVHFGCELTMSKSDGSVVHFTGLKREDMDTVKNFVQEIDGCVFCEEQISTTGQNWGILNVQGKIVSFLQSENKPIFKICLPDVSTVQHTKDEVTFEFAADDVTAQDAGYDTLVGMSLHIPTINEDFPTPDKQPVDANEDEETQTDQTKDEKEKEKENHKKEYPSKRFFKMILPHIDARGKSDLPIGTFHEVTVLVPRGKFEVQLHHSYLKMLGQAQDFKIYYNSILHLFVLPKPNPSTTTVVAALDPPIRKGQTFYHHVLFQFDSDAKHSLRLNIAQDEIDTYNVKHSGGLQQELQSWEFDVFATCLRGLSGARTIRPETFTNYSNDGSCVQCSYKTDEGFLFPLEKAFFFIHKPPLCISHDEILIIEFQRQGTHLVSASTKTFDLCIKTKQGLDHQFRGIDRSEWQQLFNFMSKKCLKIENLESVRQGPSHQSSVMRFEDMDLGLNNRSHGSSDDSDPDYAMNPNDADRDDGDSSQSDGGSSGAEMVDEAEISEPELPQEEEDGDDVLMVDESNEKPSKPIDSAEGPLSAKKRSKGPMEKEMTKKQRKKRDKNAPKKNLSAYMFYVQDIRNSIKQEQPELTFSEIGRAIGEKWKALSLEEKAKYQELADKDKVRYQTEKALYNQKTAKAEEEVTEPK